MDTGDRDTTLEPPRPGADSNAVPETPDAAAIETLDASPGTPARSVTRATSSTRREEPGDGSAPLLGRYVDLGRIARGGMGDVRRVRDHALGRALAMKVLPWEMVESQRDRARFLAEVRITASLQHPGVVPIHEAGELPDGRLWFTMKEVRGRTLRTVIAELHREATPHGTPAMRRVLEAYLRVCETVAYAHSRGVVHCDLKPDNVMIGEFGEVLVMDWGVARVLRGAEREAAPAGDTSMPERPLEPKRDPLSRSLEPLLTERNEVVGTPAYMPPEQARGQTARVGPPSDVFALGAVLHEILSGKPPYAATGVAFWLSVFDAKPLPLPDGVPAELAALATKAMAREPADRFPDARELTEGMRSWLDGARRRERALGMVAEAHGMRPQIEALRERAAALDEEARAILGPLRTYDPVAEKAKGWRLLEEKERLERQAAIEEIAWMQALRSALYESPDLPEAKEALADHYHQRLVAAEAARDENAAARSEALLRSYDRSRYAAFLRGDGALSLVTDPEGAEVSLDRYVSRDRMLVREHVRELGRTPLREVALPRGSYVLAIRAPGCEEVTYPVLIGRGEHWDGVRPGDREPTPIRLPKKGELDAGSIYVPAGWFIAGGDPEAGETVPRRRLWADAFVIRRHPATVAEYVTFLNALVAAGRETEALAACPRAPGRAGPGEDALIFARDRRGNFLVDAAVDEATCPVVWVDWHGSTAYARWLSTERRGDWRLLCELEWEKAARGVDGRFMPWGDWVEPTWACMLGSDSRGSGLASIEAFPTDVSVYGVRGMAGNVREWCLDLWKQEGPPTSGGRVHVARRASDEPGLRAARGGAWTSSLCRLASRFAGQPSDRFGFLGLRVARSLGDQGPAA